MTPSTEPPADPATTEEIKLVRAVDRALASLAELPHPLPEPEANLERNLRAALDEWRAAAGLER